LITRPCERCRRWSIRTCININQYCSTPANLSNLLLQTTLCCHYHLQPQLQHKETTMTCFGTTTHLIALLAASATITTTNTIVTVFSPSSMMININTPTYLFATANEDTNFDVPIPKNPQHAHALDHEIVVVDDECYLGKYGS